MDASFPNGYTDKKKRLFLLQPEQIIFSKGKKSIPSVLQKASQQLRRGKKIGVDS